MNYRCTRSAAVVSSGRYLLLHREDNYPNVKKIQKTLFFFSSIRTGEAASARFDIGVVVKCNKCFYDNLFDSMSVYSTKLAIQLGIYGSSIYRVLLLLLRPRR